MEKWSSKQVPQFSPFIEWWIGKRIKVSYLMNERQTSYNVHDVLKENYLPMKDREIPWGSVREMNRVVVGLAFIAKNFTIWAELTKP